MGFQHSKYKLLIKVKYNITTDSNEGNKSNLKILIKYFPESREVSER